MFWGTRCGRKVFGTDTARRKGKHIEYPALYHVWPCCQKKHVLMDGMRTNAAVFADQQAVGKVLKTLTGHGLTQINTDFQAKNVKNLC